MERLANPISIYKKFVSKDGTIKYALKLEDGEIIECVVLGVFGGVLFRSCCFRLKEPICRMSVAGFMRKPMEQ